MEPNLQSYLKSLLEKRRFRFIKHIVSPKENYDLDELYIVVNELIKSSYHREAKATLKLMVNEFQVTHSMIRNYLSIALKNFSFISLLINCLQNADEKIVSDSAFDCISSIFDSYIDNKASKYADSVRSLVCFVTTAIVSSINRQLLAAAAFNINDLANILNKTKKRTPRNLKKSISQLSFKLNKIDQQNTTRSKLLKYSFNFRIPERFKRSHSLDDCVDAFDFSRLFCPPFEYPKPERLCKICFCELNTSNNTAGSDSAKATKKRNSLKNIFTKQSDNQLSTIDKNAAKTCKSNSCKATLSSSANTLMFLNTDDQSSLPGSPRSCKALTLPLLEQTNTLLLDFTMFSSRSFEDTNLENYSPINSKEDKLEDSIDDAKARSTVFTKKYSSDDTCLNPESLFEALYLSTFELSQIWQYLLGKLLSINILTYCSRCGCQLELVQSDVANNLYLSYIKDDLYYCMTEILKVIQSKVYGTNLDNAIQKSYSNEKEFFFKYHKAIKDAYVSFYNELLISLILFLYRHLMLPKSEQELCHTFRILTMYFKLCINSKNDIIARAAYLYEIVPYLIESYYIADDLLEALGDSIEAALVSSRISLGLLIALTDYNFKCPNPISYLISYLTNYSYNKLTGSKTTLVTSNKSINFLLVKILTSLLTLYTSLNKLPDYSKENNDDVADLFNFSTILNNQISSELFGGSATVDEVVRTKCKIFGKVFSSYYSHNDSMTILNSDFLADKSPEILAQLIYIFPFSASAVGEFISRKGQTGIDILKEYLKLLDLSNVSLIRGLELFLSRFVLIGESKLIDKILQCFADAYCQRNENFMHLAKASINDVIYLLSYTCLVLHTDVHNPKVKNRISKETLVHNCRSCDDGNKIPETYLSAIYDKVVAKEWQLKSKNDVFTEYLLKYKDSNDDNSNWLPINYESFLKRYLYLFYESYINDIIRKLLVIFIEKSYHTNDQTIDLTMASLRRVVLTCKQRESSSFIANSSYQSEYSLLIQTDFTKTNYISNIQSSMSLKLLQALHSIVYKNSVNFDLSLILSYLTSFAHLYIQQAIDNTTYVKFNIQFNKYKLKSDNNIHMPLSNYSSTEESNNTFDLRLLLKSFYQSSSDETGLSLTSPSCEEDKTPCVNHSSSNQARLDPTDLTNSPKQFSRRAFNNNEGIHNKQLKDFQEALSSLTNDNLGNISKPCADILSQLMLISSCFSKVLFSSSFQDFDANSIKLLKTYYELHWIATKFQVVDVYWPYVYFQHKITCIHFFRTFILQINTIDSVENTLLQDTYNMCSINSSNQLNCECPDHCSSFDQTTPSKLTNLFNKIIDSGFINTNELQRYLSNFDAIQCDKFMFACSQTDSANKTFDRNYYQQTDTDQLRKPIKNTQVYSIYCNMRRLVSLINPAYFSMSSQLVLTDNIKTYSSNFIQCYSLFAHFLTSHCFKNISKSTLMAIFIISKLIFEDFTNEAMNHSLKHLYIQDAGVFGQLLYYKNECSQPVFIWDLLEQKLEAIIFNDVEVAYIIKSLYSLAADIIVYINMFALSLNTKDTELIKNNINSLVTRLTSSCLNNILFIQYVSAFLFVNILYYYTINSVDTTLAWSYIFNSVCYFSSFSLVLLLSLLDQLVTRSMMLRQQWCLSLLKFIELTLFTVIMNLQNIDSIADSTDRHKKHLFNEARFDKENLKVLISLSYNMLIHLNPLAYKYFADYCSAYRRLLQLALNFHPSSSIYIFQNSIKPSDNLCNKKNSEKPIELLVSTFSSCLMKDHSFETTDTDKDDAICMNFLKIPDFENDQANSNSVYDILNFYKNNILDDLNCIYKFIVNFDQPSLSMLHSLINFEGVSQNVNSRVLTPGMSASHSKSCDARPEQFLAHTKMDFFQFLKREISNNIDNNKSKYSYFNSYFFKPYYLGLIDSFIQFGNNVIEYNKVLQISHKLLMNFCLTNDKTIWLWIFQTLLYQNDIILSQLLHCSENRSSENTGLNINVHKLFNSSILGKNSYCNAIISRCCTNSNCTLNHSKQCSESIKLNLLRNTLQSTPLSSCLINNNRHITKGNKYSEYSSLLRNNNIGFNINVHDFSRIVVFKAALLFRLQLNVFDTCLNLHLCENEVFILALYSSMTYALNSHPIAKKLGSQMLYNLFIQRSHKFPSNFWVLMTSLFNSLQMTLRVSPFCNKSYNRIIYCSNCIVTEAVLLSFINTILKTSFDQLTVHHLASLLVVCYNTCLYVLKKSYNYEERRLMSQNAGLTNRKSLCVLDRLEKLSFHLTILLCVKCLIRFASSLEHQNITADSKVEAIHIKNYKDKLEVIFVDVFLKTLLIFTDRFLKIQDLIESNDHEYMDFLVSDQTKISSVFRTSIIPILMALTKQV